MTVFSVFHLSFEKCSSRTESFHIFIYYKNRTSVHRNIENKKTIQYIMTRCRKQCQPNQAQAQKRNYT